VLDAQPLPDGVVALVTRRVAGLGLDRRPLLLLVHGSAVTRVTLPATGGDVLARSLEVAWPRIVVRAADVTAFTRGEEGVVTWESRDGGSSWSVTRN